MLKFESVFWATKNREELVGKLKALGFSPAPSRRDPHTSSIFFGPEAIEIFSATDKLTTFGDQSGVSEFINAGDGIFSLGLETEDLATDYKRIKSKCPEVEKPRGAKVVGQNVPLWFGFNIPQNLTPEINAWAVMNSPTVLNQMSAENLPQTHLNTCFGIEGIHVICEDPAATADAWSKLLTRPSAGLHWNEIDRTQGRRIQAGDRFFDLLTTKGKLKAANHNVFMLTLKVTDLEYSKELCEKAGAKTLRCSSRDGFIVSSEFTGGPALRFVRSYWKKYLPAIMTNYPLGRRTDKFRPLGGTNTSTLSDGFGDNWNY